MNEKPYRVLQTDLGPREDWRKPGEWSFGNEVLPLLAAALINVALIVHGVLEFIDFYPPNWGWKTWAVAVFYDLVITFFLLFMSNGWFKTKEGCWEHQSWDSYY